MHTFLNKINITWHKKTNFVPIVVLIQLSLINISALKAQDTLHHKLGYTPNTAMYAGLIGSAIYPGFTFGIERPYKIQEIQKFKKNKTKTFVKEKLFSFNYSMYHHPNYHTNNFLNASRISRKQKLSGWYFETSTGVGISRTFVDGATFTVSDNGDISKIPFSGNWYALASFGLSWGYNANLKLQKPYSIYFRHQWILLFPYNSFVMPRPVIELGFKYNLEKVWHSNPKFSSKTKYSRFIKKQKQKV